MAFFRPMAAGHHAGHAAGLWHDAGQDAGRVEGSNNSYMDQCTLGAVRPRSGRRAAAGGEARTREERLGPLELNTLKMGFRKAVGRLGGYRRVPLAKR